MKVPLGLWLSVSVLVLALALTPPARAAGGGFEPAMVGSVASKLHYPPKEVAAKGQAAVAFQCEVRPDGDVSQIYIRCDRSLSRFGAAVDTALRAGHFQPARLGGKPVNVMVGGTVLFTLDGGKPTIAVSLVTADKEKIVRHQNYLQPQMIEAPEFRRKVVKYSYEYILHGAKDPGAEVLVHVDTQGNLTGTKLVAESPPNGNWGTLVNKALEGQKFIPAMNNGQIVAGDFELFLDLHTFRNPDEGPRTGTLLKDGESR